MTYKRNIEIKAMRDRIYDLEDSVRRLTQIARALLDNNRIDAEHMLVELEYGRQQ